MLSKDNADYANYEAFFSRSKGWRREAFLRSDPCHLAELAAKNVEIARNSLTGEASNAYARRMKTLTMREFFHSPALTRSLHPGQTLVVTSHGKADLLVSKAGRRPVKTAAELQKEAKALLSKPGRKVDTAALLRRLRQ